MMRLRFLFVSTYFHPIIGGAERQLLALGQAFRRRGHDVTVLTCRFSGLGDQEMVDGISVHRAIRPFGRGPVYAASYVSGVLRGLMSRRGTFDAVLANLLFLDAWTAARVGAKLGVPVVARAAGGGATGDVARLRRVIGGRLLARGLRRIDRVVAPSRAVEAELRGAGWDASRIARIPNGVDAEHFAPAAAAPESIRRDLQLSGPLVVCVGRLDWLKGVDILLEAWPMVRTRVPGASLALVGGGPARAALQARAAASGLTQRVQFVGEAADVRPYLQAADVFVMPSRVEGMSNALLEAMATGKPCVATRIGGTEEIIRSGVTGVLVEPGQPAALADAIGQVLQDRRYAADLGRAARAAALDNFSISASAHRYLALYAQLLHAPGEATVSSEPCAALPA